MKTWTAGLALLTLAIVLAGGSPHFAGIAAWWLAGVVVIHVATDWRAHRGTPRPYRKAEPAPTRAWPKRRDEADRVKELADAHRKRLDRIEKSALTPVQKRALVSRAEREYQSRIQDIL